MPAREAIDALEREIEEQAVVMIARRQPMAFDLRQIMAALRAKRAAELDLEDESEALADEPAVPLAETVHQFWASPQPLTDFKTSVKPPLTELPVLKRLGQPTFLQEDILKLLGPAYQKISQQAIATAFTEAEEAEAPTEDEAQP